MVDTSLSVTLSTIGESTQRGWGQSTPPEGAQRVAYDAQNPNMVPLLAAQQLGLGVGQKICAVKNMAISGVGTTGQLQSIVPDAMGVTRNGPMRPVNVAAAQSQLVLITLGTNDAYDGVPVALFMDRIRALVINELRLGRRIFIQLPPSIGTDTPYRDGIATKSEPLTGTQVTVKQRLELYAQELIKSQLGTIVSRPASQPMVDPFHPTNAHYAAMAAEVVKVLGPELDRFNVEFQVALLYTSVFRRAVEASALDFWGGALLRGQLHFQDGTLATELLKSTPYLKANLTNEQFVDAVYRFDFGRAPAASEISFWAGALNNGRTRGSILTDMLTSCATYQQVGGTDVAGLKSQRLILNRTAVALSRGAIYRQDSLDPAYPNGVLAKVTDDPNTAYWS